MLHVLQDKLASIVMVIIIALLIVVPLAMRPDEATPPANAERLIVITPHNTQIRWEFERAFSDWHEREYGTPVVIDYRRPGGTSEIRKQLKAIYEAAVRGGRIAPDGSTEPGTMPYDLFFGGGSYEHGQAKQGVTVEVDGRTVSVPISTRAGFSEEYLYETYGANRIGSSKLYDPEQYWLGVCVSSFGILYNKDLLAVRNLPEPTSWNDMTDPRYDGLLALGDPRQSGSIATTYESILNMQGWDDGWRTLRAMSANARYFTGESKKVVLDISRGDAAAGVAIDFYGRFQAQAVVPEGMPPESSRLGYVDPDGETLIDPDPISLLRGGPNPELAEKFLRFALTVEGQAIWNFPAVGEDAPPDAMGPRRSNLRRMPIRRVMYEQYLERFVDQVNPYGAATNAPSRGWRSMLGPMFGAFAIDVHGDMKTAWDAMNATREAGESETLAEMEWLFYAMPTHVTPEGEELEFNEANYRAIREDWRDDEMAPEYRIRYTRFFRENYERIVDMGKQL